MLSVDPGAGQHDARLALPAGADSSLGTPAKREEA